jgi:hypothetical protein
MSKESYWLVDTIHDGGDIFEFSFESVRIGITTLPPSTTVERIDSEMLTE